MKRNFKLLLKTSAFTAAALAATGFMFFSPGKIAWYGDTPVIKFDVRVNTEAFEQSDAFQWIQIIQDSGVDWFKQGQAKAALNSGDSYSGTGFPSSYSAGICSGPDIKYAEVFTAVNEDIDCTSSSCVHLWSCEGRDGIINGSIQMNLSGYHWSFKEEPGYINLKREIMHDFGHLLGLNHCRAGEKNCNGDPADSSVMYKFTDSGVTKLSNDDVQGLQELYGALTLPFPTEGKYALTGEDVSVITGVMEYMDQIGVNDPESKQSFNNYSMGLAAFSVKKTGKSMEQQTHDFFQKALATLPGSSSEALRLGIKFNTMAIFLSDRWIKEASITGKSPFDVNVMGIAKNYHVQLRERSIDILESRP